MSTSCRTFLCDKSLRSLISRSAVMGNYQLSDDWAANLASKLAYPIFLMVHNDLLEGNMGSRLLGFRAMHLTVELGLARKARRRRANLPKGTLTQLAKEIVICDSRASYKACPGALVLHRKSARRVAGVGRAGLHDGWLRCAARSGDRDKRLTCQFFRSYVRDGY